MQNVAAYLYRAKQKSGKNHLFTYFEAKSDDHAETKRDFLFMEAGHSKADYFAPVRIDFPVVDELPAEGEFSETFWLTWALESDAGKTCVPRDTLDPSVAFPKLYPYMTKPAGGAGAAENSRTTEVVQEQQKTAGEYFASSLDKHTVIAAAWLYGNNCLKLNDEQLAAAKALVMDDAQRYPQNVILALTSLKQFAHTYPEMPITVISGMKAIWPPFGKVPELGKLCQFATEYLDATVEQRAGVISKWQTSAVGGTKPAETAPEGPLRTESGAILTNGAEPATGTPIDSLQMLETVIGCALYPSDFDISNPPGAIIRAVTEMKKRNDAALKAWNEQLSATPGVLQFSRQAIVALIRGAEENLHVTPGALRSYINANLIEIDEKPAQQKAETVQQAASKAGEKDEVVTEFETERCAWLRAEIRAALAGTTGVMDESDIEELTAAVGEGISHSYIARLLAKEIETCDPFKQLVADEVHHLTCDVLKNWQDKKEPRVAFIDSRVEFYLQEARRASEQKCQEMAAAIDGAVSTPLPQENPEPARVDDSDDGKKNEIDQHRGELRSMGGGHFSYDPAEMFAASPLAKVDVAGDTTGDDVREFLDSSTETADVSGETEELSGENADTAAPVEVQNEAAAAIVDAPRREEPAAPAYFEPGRYLDIPNEVYHSANGISSTMVKDARVSLMYFEARHVSKTIKKERSPVLDMGNLVHALALQPDDLEKEFSVEPEIPEGAFTTTATIRAFIDEYNAGLSPLLSADDIKVLLEAHNATLPQQIPMGDDVAQTGENYMALPAEFQRVEDGQKVTAAKMKACIKEYNATLPAQVKTSGSRDALLEQLALINPDLVAQEAQKPQPLKVSGTKTDLIQAVKIVNPDAVFADELLDAWRDNPDGKVLVTRQQLSTALAIQKALLNHPTAGKLLTHRNRAVEVSYFGFDDETGLEVRVRPDLEIDLEGVRIGADLKTISMWNVKQDGLRARLHREIIDRDYHLSAAMYSEIAALDQFFWIFVNKDENYHWIAIIEASSELLELGMMEYRKAMRAIGNGFDTGVWPAPITEDYAEELNDFDLRRLEALRVA
ncbi:PD-(D/E)XK nuclease-like domain-containing protein [Serratia marcescens]|jgi:exodeoxyribonuclease VIII|uniref:PD-(D/E)XK nuclease-like domain-containing protein n=1 Tax=Serratia marcescens TaxID=615 RepID=UPI0027E42081|nr:PD-(D/E)XK nuclease-like domain-containing protein [Serratia marcescens]